MRAWLISYVALAFLHGCGDEPSSTSDAGTQDASLTCESTLAAVSTATLQTEVIDKSCKTACHDSKGRVSPDLSDAAKTQLAVDKLSGYAGGKASLKVVDPTNLGNSTFWLKILGGTPAGKRGPNGEAVGGPMPQSGSLLPEAQQTLVKGWICSGAKP